MVWTITPEEAAYAALAYAEGNGSIDPVGNTGSGPDGVFSSTLGRVGSAFSDFFSTAFETATNLGSNLVDFWAYETLLGNRPVGFIDDQGDMTPVAGQTTNEGIQLNTTTVLIAGVAVLGVILIFKGK